MFAVSFCLSGYLGWLVSRSDDVGGLVERSLDARVHSAALASGFGHGVSESSNFIACISNASPVAQAQQKEENGWKRELQDSCSVSWCWCWWFTMYSDNCDSCERDLEHRHVLMSCCVFNTAKMSFIQSGTVDREGLGIGQTNAAAGC